MSVSCFHDLAQGNRRASQLLNAFWYAEASEPVEAGETVRIIGNKRLCLLVEKVTQAATSPHE